MRREALTSANAGRGLLHVPREGTWRHGFRRLFCKPLTCGNVRAEWLRGEYVGKSGPGRGVSYGPPARDLRRCGGGGYAIATDFCAVAIRGPCLAGTAAALLPPQD
ncbi:hypothetical protein GCM10009817_27320 [Terrabacter lapilli]|uniref:Uncharacterized protein n=1 Tax=Terrabacter lapilli TaxID=436231 RepID=A0ABN2SCM2_9MICO